MIKNILIVCHSNIGDLCYDLVVVHPLRVRFPGARISLLTSSRAGNIAEGFRGLDEVIVFDKRAGGRLRLMWSLAKRRFDLAVVLKDTMMPYLLGIPRVWKAKKCSGTGATEHTVNRNLAFLRSHGVEANDAIFGFVLERADEEFRDRFCAEHGIGAGEKIIGIFPLAAWSLKNWPVERWNALAEVLQDRHGIRTIAFGRNNGDPFNTMVAAKISPRILWADTPTLKQAMALIGRCSLFIGPDSSLLHLASCMGSETVALYAPTSCEYIYPYFHKHNIITPKKMLDCAPCYPGPRVAQCGGKFRSGPCMEGISVDDVLGAIRATLGRGTPVAAV